MSDLTKDDLLAMPRHKLMSMCKELNINVRPVDKKNDLVAMLLAGKEKERTRPTPRVLDNNPKTPRAHAELPQSAIDLAAQMGVRYEIQEQDCAVIFYGEIPVSCNLDMPEKNILAALRQTSKGRKRPVEVGHTKGSFV